MNDHTDTRSHDDPSFPLEMASLLSNHVSTPFLTHPDFMSSVRINVDSVTRSKGLLLRLLIVRIGHNEFSTQDQMRCETRVGMRAIVCVSGPRSAVSGDAWSRW